MCKKSSSSGYTHLVSDTRAHAHTHTHTHTLTLMNNCQELATLPHIGEHRGEGGERNQRTSGRTPMPSQVLRPSKPSSTVTDESTFFSVYLSPSTRTITHTHTHTHTRTHAHTHAPTHARTHAHTYRYTKQLAQQNMALHAKSLKVC